METHLPSTGEPVRGAPGTVELYVDSGCPNAHLVRNRLRQCLAERPDWRLREHRDTGRLSPTVLVAGRDVVAGRDPGTGCRLDLPSGADLRRALQDREEER